MNKTNTATLKKIADQNEGHSFKNIEKILKGEKELKISSRASFKPAPIRDEKITLADLQEEVRILAYLKWEEAGYPEGDGCQFWKQAEEELFGPEIDNGYYVYIRHQNGDMEYKLIQ